MKPQSKIFPISDNLRAVAHHAEDNSRAVIIQFQARERRELVCFEVRTSAPILSSMWEMPDLKGGHWLSLGQSQREYFYAITIDKEFLDSPFIVGLEIDSSHDPIQEIESIAIWDKEGGEFSMAYVEL
jgi:hypothetical protein